MPRERRPNHLANEKSPYLQQHAYNPVDWYPWGEEAFALAKRDNKPIFLSVGYSTCHWCHVMERESFEDEAVADLLNRSFVSIKVDREERPDVDKIYMTALQAMGQNGGWPMSMFLTPDLYPFWGGTYFPPKGRYGRAGFAEILSRIHDAWTGERNKVGESAAAIAAFLKEAAETSKPPAGKGGRAVLDLCFRQLRDTFDGPFGGFGAGPKFPRPVVFGFLLRYHALTGESAALEMAERTLQKMSVGGICDQIGGGFHRYAVDGEWRVPHFEKMLYDQAQLASAYLELYQVTHDEYSASIARDVFDYVLRDMCDAGGGFFSAEDADSPRPEDPGESGEGAFYVWTKQEIQAVLGGGNPDDAGLFCDYYGVEAGGNALADPQHEFTGRNILYVARPIEDLARRYGLSDDSVRMSLIASKKKLFEVRSHRPRPMRDEKILGSWNGLMVSAFAMAAGVLGDARYSDAARQGMDFLLGTLPEAGSGLLRRRFCAGVAGLEAQLDDYAFIIQALVDLYEVSGEFRYLRSALHYMERQIDLFWDQVNGGFYESSGRDPSLLVRLKEQHDGAEPSGNAVSVMNLLRLSEITDNAGLREKAERTLAAFSATLGTHPVAMPHMASALARSLSAPKQIVLAGEPRDPALRVLQAEVYARYLPDRVLLFADGGTGQRELSRYLPFLDGVTTIDRKPAAYVCEHYACRLPTTDVNVLREQLAEKRGTAPGMNS